MCIKKGKKKKIKSCFFFWIRLKIVCSFEYVCVYAAVGQRDVDQANDYFFRDSFDHSSTESQLVDASGKPHSRSITPVPKMQKLQNAKLCLQAGSGSSPASMSRRGDARTKQQQSIHVVRLFIPAFLLTIIVLFIVIVIIFETDATVFNSLRKTPEMVALRNHYYGPIKEFLRTKLGLFFWLTYVESIRGLKRER